MTYDEAMAYIEKTEKLGSVLGLERIKMLLNRLGNPQDALRLVHVAGTNGKGSFCAFLSSILETAGYKVGRFISPTLYDYRERIQINRQMIGKDALAECMESIAAVCRQMSEEGFGHPTAFEIETAMAMMYFKAQCCDAAVIEVGVGGRMDSTNVIKRPLLSVITEIGMDHMKLLGDTIEQIAGEKAGIIKEGCPVLSYAQRCEVMPVLEAACAAAHTRLHIAGFDKISLVKRRMSGQTFNYRQFEGLKISLAGTYQIQNAAAAIDAALLLREQGYSIEEAHIRRGLLQASWHGRFEKISANPTVIVDGAHNPDGAKVLADSIKAYFNGRRLIYMMGVFADKDYREILKVLRPFSDTLITLCPPSDRGLPSAALAAEAKAYYPTVIDGQNVRSAYQYALKCANDDDIIISFGSLSTIGDFYDIIKTISGKRGQLSDD